MRTFYSSDHDPGLTALLFDRWDIQQCIQSIKSENGWISRVDATKLLKIKDITLTRWAKFGLISPIFVLGSIQYFDQKTIEKFIVDHITTEEAVEILGVGKLTVQKWARQGRLSIACVSGPNIDGHHGYIFHRARLIQWREDNIYLRINKKR